MAFYDLGKEERKQLVDTINNEVLSDLQNNVSTQLLRYFSDEDTYIRKAAYQAIGKIYIAHKELRTTALSVLKSFLESENHSIRQTTVNAAGEIGMQDFDVVQHIFDTALSDSHHSVRNAVIGSLKKMGNKNPDPALNWAKSYLGHPDKEIRREICHGIELRGRTHPQDILPLLRELQWDATSRVRDTLVHVLGQIAYKKGCLAIVIQDLNSWDNTELLLEAIDEIIDVHRRYHSFAALTVEEAIDYIDSNFKHKQ